jgi:PAS domain S-box-containing protein
LGGEASTLTALLDILAEAVTIRDRSGQIVYANRAALATMEMTSIEQLRGQDGREIMAEYTVEDEHGQPLTIDDLPGVKVLAGGDPEPLLIRVVDRHGTVFWRLLKTSVLNDRRGRFAGAMTVIEDITAVKNAEVRTRVLAESGRILASSLDYEETLRNVAQVSVPALADYCGVDLVDDDGYLQRVAAAHRDPRRGALVAQLQSIERYLPEPASPAGQVLLTGSSKLYDEITGDELVETSRGETHLSLIRELGVHSAVIVPMRVPGRTIGLLTLATTESRRRITNEDVDLAEQLGRRAAVAVENSRLHTTVAQVAQTLERSLQPDPLPDIPGWETAALYRAAQSELRLDVGGDFYDFYKHEGTWFVIVGDVTGKGVKAATVTALMRHGARFASNAEPEPAAILRRLDEALKQQPDEPALCTAICMALHDDHIVISSGGHPPALLVCGASGEIRRAPQPGPILGAFDDAEWPQQRVEISSRELVVLYTDGVTETRGRNDRFGIERLRALASEHADRGPAAFLAELERTLDEFAHGSSRDDVAVVALRATGAGRSPAA